MRAVPVMRLLTVGLLCLGAAALVIACAWWWIIFHQVIAYEYLPFGDALKCLGSGSGICELAMSLCGTRHPFGLAKYSTSLFWASLAALSASLATSAWRAAA